MTRAAFDFTDFKSKNLPAAYLAARLGYPNATIRKWIAAGSAPIRWHPALKIIIEQAPKNDKAKNLWRDD